MAQLELLALNNITVNQQGQLENQRSFLFLLSLYFINCCENVSALMNDTILPTS